MNKHVLKGGNSNRVIKDANTVVRKMGQSPRLVHALLQHLAAAGFTESPVLIETFGDQERLSYIEGEVGNYPLKPYMQSAESLTEVARLLRRFHDVSRNFAIPFKLPASDQASYEVICHNDFAPYNLVYQAGHVVGIIDFDTAAPGTRVWDVAYAVYRFVPLTNDAHSVACGWNPLPDRAARLRQFCDAYGLEVADRAKLIETVQERLKSLVAYMQVNNSNLEHIPLYMDDLAYLKDQQDHLTQAITR
ncbi:MAG: aminoglycoside phosphotransferase family protein [Chloroflexi bacterium]|nr:aminoglycoside phosphotransferase family protein [Chloroflexota bacterium]MCC6895464.1 aminoglycoside phosphotransferase family protein [Anaerolineae bacterium]